MPAHFVFGIHSLENVEQFRKALPDATHVILESDSSVEVAKALLRNPRTTKASVLRDLRLMEGDLGPHYASEQMRTLLKDAVQHVKQREGVDTDLLQEHSFLNAIIDENIARKREGRELLRVFREPHSDNFNRDWEAGVAMRQFADAVVKEQSFDLMLANFRESIKVKTNHFVKREKTLENLIHSIDAPKNTVMMAAGSLHAPLAAALAKKGVKVTTNKRFADPTLDAKVFIAARKAAPIPGELAVRAMFFMIGSHQLARERTSIREAVLKLSRFLEKTSTTELRELFERARREKRPLPKAIVEAAGLNA